MKWVEEQNKRSKNVADFIDLFKTNKDSNRVYRPINLMYEQRFSESEPTKFMHISDHLFTKKYKQIDGEHDWNVDKEDVNLKYDLIFADLPIRMSPREEFIFDKKIKVGTELNHLAKCMSRLTDNGKLFCILPPSIFWGQREKRLLDSIASNGYHYESIIDCSNVWEGLTGIKLLLVLFTKKARKKVFIGKLRDENLKVLKDNFSNNIDESITNGKFIDKKLFVSVDRLLYEEQIESKGNFSGIPKVTLAEISKEVIKGKFQETLPKGINAIYIPSIGKSNVVTDIKETSLKHQNLFKIELDEKKAINSYLMYFLNTDIGIDYRKSLETGTSIKTISKQSIIELTILLPDLKKQKKIVSASKHLDKLLGEIKRLKKNLAYNPSSVDEIDTSSRKFYSKLSSISEEDKIIDIIGSGENKVVEFKETFGYNPHTNDKRDERLIKSSGKNIVAFINSNGGKLFIGVNDAGDITGIEEELNNHKSLDDFKLFFTEIVAKKIGAIYNTHVDYKIHTIKDKKILIADCKKSDDKAVFYEEKEFYMRHNPKAQLLEGSELVEYINNRFK